jgi:hypothetical protein
MLPKTLGKRYHRQVAGLQLDLFGAPCASLSLNLWGCPFKRLVSLGENKVSAKEFISIASTELIVVALETAIDEAEKPTQAAGCNGSRTENGRAPRPRPRWRNEKSA